jgi:hypothetical protein
MTRCTIGGEDQTRGDEEYQARVKRIKSGEQLAGIRSRRVHGAHSSHEHRRIHKRIAPWELLGRRRALPI